MKERKQMGWESNNKKVGKRRAIDDMERITREKMR